jgi:CRP/FNR family transcriptional activator FtrB
MIEGGGEPFGQLPLLADLPEPVAGRLVSMADARRFRPGEILFRDGERDESVRILTSGLVELSRIARGRECGVLILSAGDLIMPAAALFDEPYLSAARALTPVRMLLIDAAVLRAEMAGCPELALRMLRIVGGQWRMAVRHILDLKSRNAPERLGAFLLRLVDEGPLADSAELPIPKRHLAARVGMTAETLSRTLHILAQNGLFVRGRRILVRVRARIEHFCGPDPYSDRTEAKLSVQAL